MINNKTLNKYMTSATENEVVEERKEQITLEVLNELQDVMAQLDKLQADKDFKQDVEEEGFPDDIGLAIVKIREDAKGGNEKAIKALNKITDALSL